MFNTKNKTVFDYDKDVTFEKRIEEVKSILGKHPNKIPIIIQKTSTSKLQNPNKSKFLAPPEQTFGEFTYQIRKRLSLTPEQALFLFVKEFAPSMSATLGEIYETHKCDDGFLKISFCEENTFGSNQ
ncbi:putative microtubule-associated protein [Bodo saltans virus]|uniref:Microtubule-associated protein n=1 Tax=Bodo saltans virus TaxID=2024608 RepID=A0A2H4UVG5_9VIRU|nr:putative microtubule-associated protein [Bodo saltans virus]ATZ80857.1 putative microtubule-associated protein [Bodo saltans virus]